MKKIFLYLIIIIFVCGCSSSKAEETRMISSITTDSVFSMIDREGVYILDVREEYEYKSGHIKNAYNIPLTKINGIKKNEIPLDAIIIVYCKSGNRSKKAAEILLDLGYQNIYDMGGVNSWEFGLISE